MSDSDAPLRWRWERWEINDEVDEALTSHVWNLRDARGGLLLVVPEDNCNPSPYVRAVTERAGAMEKALLAIRDQEDHDEYCDSCRVRAAIATNELAEIDAAKAGGAPELCYGQCNKFGCDIPCDQLKGHAGACSCRNRRVKAVVDAGTCATCRAADGTIGRETPACEHVANGTGVCRCVLVQAKAGGDG